MPNEWEKGNDEYGDELRRLIDELFAPYSFKLSAERIDTSALGASPHNPYTGPGFLYRDGPVIGLDASMALLASVYGCPVELVDDVLRVEGL